MKAARGFTVALALAAPWGAPARADAPPATSPANWMFAWQDGPLSTTFTPSVWMNGRGIGVSLGGSYAVGVGGSREYGTFDGAALELHARGARPTGDAARPFGILSSRIHAGRATTGAWLGAAAMAARAGGQEALPLAGVGAWMSRGRLTLSWQIVQLLRPVPVGRRIVTAPSPRDSAGASRDEVLRLSEVTDYRYLSGAESAVSWRAWRLELQSRAGVAVGLHVRPARWGELRATTWARRDVGVFGRVGSASNVARVIESPPGLDASIGIQFAPGRADVGRATGRAHRASAIELQPLGGGLYRLVVDARGRDVELSSDATDWQPVAARLVATRRWEVLLTLSPGVHRILMRSGGGAWKPVPGLPTGADEFGGVVSLLAVE